MTVLTPFAASLLTLALLGPADDCAALRARVAELENEVIALRSEVAAANESRLAREQEFLRFTQGIAALQSLALPLPPFTPRTPAERPKILDVPIDPALAAAAAGVERDATARSTSLERDRAVFSSLRMLLAAEQVTSLDLLESGQVHDDWVGPVVMRVLDDRGRPLGSIAAERMRLEASRAARMITIVLEQGYERRGNEKVAFEGGPVDSTGRGGVRRIALPDCDPLPWIEHVPELFKAVDLDRSIDDGRYDLGALRATLNQLLKAEAASGWYRVHGLGGVQGNVLRDVALDRLDKFGYVESRYFADRLSILRETSGVQLSLEGGSHVRRSQKAPFLDGRCRIFLPRADIAVWEKAGLPGLKPAVEAPVAPVK
ncbi:MAG: hypothetical protein JNL28_00990 [Planctomycetes bacterium]|nr:hypothetical protein [Planctomycetota bacterium]